MPRDSSGVYTLPPSNPVVTNTPIQAGGWANPTLSDIGNEITNSLDRAGRGGMTGPFGIVDGTLAAPGLRWTTDPDNGLRRTGVNTWTLVAGAVDVAEVTPSTFSWGGSLILRAVDKGVANGVASLDGTGKVPTAQLPPLGVAQADTMPVLVKGELWFDSNKGTMSVRYQNPDLTFTDIAVNVAGGDYIPLTQKGVANGVAALDANGVVAQSTITLPVPQALTSGTFKDFFFAPVGTKRVIVSITNVVRSGSSNLAVQIGPSSGVVGAGYNGASSGTSTASAATAYTTAFGIHTQLASDIVSGVLILTLVNQFSNLWSFSAACSNYNVGPSTFTSGGTVTLAGPFSALRFTCLNGTDTFLGGTINVQYEF